MVGQTITPLKLDEKTISLIEKQLEKVLQSQFFKSAQQMTNFLRFIVSTTIEGKTGSLKQFTIAVEALNFPEDFDPDSNPAVRILGGRVRDRLNQYYESHGKQDPLVINIPKGSYIPQFEQNNGQISVPKSKISCGPKLALVCFTDNTQKDQTNRFLFNITDTLAKEMCRFMFSRLIVYNPYADKTQSSKVEQELKLEHSADYALTLFLQQLNDDKLQLIYRLLDVNSHEVLWSESYEITADVPIKEQDNILAEIISTIIDLHQGILHTHWSQRLLEDQNSIPLEYKVLVYYRFFADDFSQESFIKSSQICWDILQQNPNDIIANLVFSDYCRRQYVYGYSGIDNPLEKGLECAQRAIQLRPNSHEAHYALAQILFCKQEWESCIDELKLAREISTYHTVIEYGCGFHLCMMGHWEEGMEMVNKVISLSASCFPSWYHLMPFLNFYRQEKYQEALAEAKKIHATNILHGPLSRCIAYAQLGDKENAKLELKEVLNRHPTFSARGYELLSRFMGNKELTDHIWQGLQKALA